MVLGIQARVSLTLGKRSVNPVTALALVPIFIDYQRDTRHWTASCGLSVFHGNMAQTLDSADKLTEGLLAVVDAGQSKAELGVEPLAQFRDTMVAQANPRFLLLEAFCVLWSLLPLRLRLSSRLPSGSARGSQSSVAPIFLRVPCWHSSSGEGLALWLAQRQKQTCRKDVILRPTLQAMGAVKVEVEGSPTSVLWLTPSLPLPDTFPLIF